jgi:tight adherence protein B
MSRETRDALTVSGGEMDYFLPVLIFIVVLILVELGYFALRGFRSSEKKGVRTRLKALAVQAEKEEAVDILKKDRLSDIPWLHSILRRFSTMGKLSLLVEQAGVQRKPGLYILLSITLAVIGFLAGAPFHSVYFPLVPSLFVIIPCTVVPATLPFIYLRYKRGKRFHKFEEQLPEALDLIARSLKAGHAFSSGLRLVSEEMEDPIGFEFEKALNEINFGVAAQEALIGMTDRIPLDDLRFFVISVILQRETGGNLAEILENLSRLIRERFKLNGHVRVLSSQARLSAYILVVIPFVIALGLHLINREYYKAFFENPSGKYVLASGMVWMILGFFVMKKMVKIRV